MIDRKNTLIISVLGIATILSGLAIHNHMVRVNAAKLAHAVPPAPYFPARSLVSRREQCACRSPIV